MRIHVRNVLALSVAFFIIQSAYLSLQNLASSLYATGGLGLASLATIYVCYALSCLASPVVIKYVGTKWTVVASIVCYCLYIAMNFYPTYYTLIPAAIIMGMSAGPLWSSQGTHLTSSAMNLADITGETHEAVIGRFNGIFFFFFLASQVPGNLVSSLVLYSGTEGAAPNDTDLSVCGANECGPTGDSNSTSSYEPDQTTVYILFGTLLAWGACGIPVAAIFMNPLSSFCATLPPEKSSLEQIKATARLILSPKLYLLIPLIIFNGLELGFAYGDFTKAFVSCTAGLQTIGFVMTAYGIGGGLSALALGVIGKYTGRLPIFTLGFASTLILMSMMTFWDPTEGEVWHLYLMAVTWSFGGALRESQIAGFFGVLFPKDQEPAFANFRFWQALSYSFAFASSIPDFVCVSYKMAGLLGNLCLGMGLYYLLEWRIRHDLRQDDTYKGPVSEYKNPLGETKEGMELPSL